MIKKQLAGASPQARALDSRDRGPVLDLDRFRDLIVWESAPMQELTGSIPTPRPVNPGPKLKVADFLLVLEQVICQTRAATETQLGLRG
jgi:hypothetical protein